MKSLSKKILLVLLFSIVNHVYGGIEPVNVRVQGDDLYDLKGSASTFDISDNKYWIMADGFWDSEFSMKSVQNKVTLGIDESDMTFQGASFAYRVKLDIDFKQMVGLSLHNSSLEGIVLEIDYNPARGTTYQDRNVFNFVGGVDVKVEVVTIEKLVGGVWEEVITSSLPSSLFLESEIITERYYPFNQTEIPSESTSLEVIGDELKVVWPFMDGAEDYELEWTWVNGYSGELDGADNPIILAASASNYNFELNATRVRISGRNSYTIPLIYGEGYILVRYRGIGRGGSSFNIPLEGTWNSESDGLSGTAGVVSDFGTVNVNYIPVSAHEANDINYGAGMSFIEGGVRSVGVTYMDGVLKPRQSQAKLNSQEKIIAGSTVYDHYGRPAIGVMSTPVDQNTLGYIDNLNMHSDGTVYGKQHFDLDGTDADCGEFNAAPPMSSTLSEGAANYYSADNPDKEGANAYLPDAEGYPFVQVEYANDPTGRIKRVGGLGPDHQLGEVDVDGNVRDAHYTEYFYDVPDDEELYELFGNDVIGASNYTKVITKDVHGQLSVAITDPMGRTVATYMAGAAPAGLEAIEGNDGLSPATKDLMKYNAVKELEGITVGNHPIMVMDPSVVYDFTYDFTASSYTDCLPVESLCFDCIYDVVINIIPDEFNENCRIKDETGTNIDDETTGIVTYSYTVGSIETFDPTNCETPLTFSGANGVDASEFSVQFPTIGTYQIVKTLVVNQTPEVLDFYWNLYKENSTCLLTEEDFLEDIMSYIDPSDCDDLSPCEFNFLLEHGTLAMYLEANPSETESDYNDLKTDYLDDCGTQNTCDVLYPAMHADYKTGGQYCLADLYATGPDLASAILLSSMGAPTTMIGILTYGPFYEIDGETESTFDLDGDGYFESTVSDLTLTQFTDNWKDSWAVNFVGLHPEYCYYTFCADHGDLFDFEQDMLAAETYADACALGLVDPFPAVGTYPSPSDVTCTATLDPLYSFTLTTEMVDILQTEYNVGGVSDLDIYEYAVYLAGDDPALVDFGEADCLNDKHWQIFRSLYFSKRFQVIDLLKDQYVADEGCSYAPCIGTADAPCAGSGFEDKIKRYFNYESAFFDLDTPGIDWEDEAGDVDVDLDVICLDQCEGLADTWMEQLSGCVPEDPETWESGQTTYDLVRAKLIEVCAGGCDGDWPMPTQFDDGTITDVSDPDPANWVFGSFEDVITSYVGLETVECSHLLITNPLPNSTDESLVNYLEDCGCNLLLSTTDADNFADLYGYYPIDYDYEKCLCTGYDNGAGGATAADGILNYDEATNLNNDDVLTPNTYPCGSDCINCDGIADLKIGFITAYSPATYLTEPELFTAYVNEQSGGAYSYELITYLIENCDIIAGPETGEPIYHLLDKKAHELRDLLNELAEGGFTTTQTGLGLLDIPEYLNSSLYPCDDEGVAIFNYTPSIISDVLSFDLTNTACTGSCSFSLNVESATPAGFLNDTEVLDNIISFGVPYMQTDFILGSLGTLYFNATVAHPDGGTVEVPIRLFNICHNFVVSHLTTIQGYASFQICTGEFEFEEDDCLDALIETAENAAEEAYNEYLARKEAEFKRDYVSTCSVIADETFNVDFQSNTYHYTLLYYDQSGNLVKTVPPGGVNPLTDISGVLAHAENSDASPPVFPNHTFETVYKHNSLNQVIEVTTPDGGTSKYFYDHLGRLVVSQNAKQADFNTGIITGDIAGGGSNIPAYSYTRYDELGRVTEVGEIIHPNVMTKLMAKDPVALLNWLNEDMVGAVPVIRNNITQMYYDDAYSADATAAFGVDGYGATRNRITATAVISDYVYPSGGVWTYPAPDYVNHYKYDLHGNVTTYLQEIADLTEHDNQFRTVDYEYDLISGNPNYIYFQKGKSDQYIHHYVYDKDNRLKEVFTSAEGQIWDRDVNYEYREDGYLARTEIGEMKVQGMDYAYTLHGWLKTLNSGVLNADFDMGRDGRRDGTTEFSSHENEVHGLVAQDALAYTIGYYENDYASISQGVTDFDNMQITVPDGSAFDNDRTNLYNGNITSLITNLTNFDGNKLDVNANTYHYDQLHRFKDMRVFSSGSITSSNSLSSAARSNLEVFSITESDGTAGTRSLGDYEVHVDYDQNGNIMKLIRMADYVTGLDGGGATTSDNGMDEFSYIYEAETNKLTQVTDNNDNNVATIGGSPVDFGDIKNGQTTDNYVYHADGSLKSDLDEEIAYIDWYPSGKIKRIYRTNTSEQSDIYFEYDPTGMRTLKVEMTRTGTTINDASVWEYTYYACDANGTALAIYQLDVDDQDKTLEKTESMLYGGSRLGMDVDKVTVSGLSAEAEDWATKCNTDGLASAVIKVGPYAPVDGSNISVKRDGAAVGEITWSGLDIEGNATDLKDALELYPDVTVTMTEVDIDVFYIEIKEDFEGAFYGDITYWIGASESESSLIRNSSIGECYSQRQLGLKYYELSNHLGNVMEVVSDRKISVDQNTYDPVTGDLIVASGDLVIDYYTADVVQYSDYYPYGMTQPGRNGSIESYRYGFNGKELDDEISGSRNSYDFGARQYDPRLGRWMSRDPLEAKYPFSSPYVFVGNKPIIAIDPDGRDIIITITAEKTYYSDSEGRTVVEVTYDVSINMKVINLSSTNIDIETYKGEVEAHVSHVFSNQSTYYYTQYPVYVLEDGKYEKVENIRVEGKIGQVTLELDVIESIDDIGDSDHVVGIVNEIAPSERVENPAGIAQLGDGTGTAKFMLVEPKANYSEMLNTFEHELGHMLGMEHVFHYDSKGEMIGNDPEQLMGYYGYGTEINGVQLGQMLRNLYTMHNIETAQGIDVDVDEETEENFREFLEENTPGNDTPKAESTNKTSESSSSQGNSKKMKRKARKAKNKEKRKARRRRWFSRTARF